MIANPQDFLLILLGVLDHDLRGSVIFVRRQSPGDFLQDVVRRQPERGQHACEETGVVGIMLFLMASPIAAD